MSSSFSNLKFELIGTGEQSGFWGSTTNANIGTAIEQAIVGMATLTSADFTANVATLTLANTTALQSARALCLNIAAGAVSAAGTINVPAIQKPYIVINGSSFAVTVKVSGLTGVAVPAGKRTVVYNDGTDVGDQTNYLTSLVLGTALPVASGGTGFTTLAGASIATYAGTETLTNKEIVKRVVAVADANSITPNADTSDIVTQANTQAIGTLTMNAPSGSAVNGQALVIRISSTAVQTFAWNAIYQGSTDLTLPTATSGAGKTDYLGFIYNSTTSKWQALAKNFGF
jgi:hypothetical protein